MAEYLIQDSTLDAIADAINAKTGGSSAMTPAEMVTAIGNISGGGGGIQTISYIDWQNLAIVSKDGQIVALDSRCTLPHGLYKYRTMFVPSDYDFAIFAATKPTITKYVNPSTEYIGGWTGSNWNRSLTWLAGGSTFDLSQLPNWSSYILVIELRNHSADTPINPSACSNVVFTFDLSDGAFIL